jgi:hypothetical protein
MLNTNSGTSFWNQQHNNPTKPIEKPVEKKPEIPDFMCPVIDRRYKGEKSIIKVIEFPDAFNHLVLEMRIADESQWKPIYDPVLYGTETIEVLLPDEAVCLRWHGIHPERGNKESAVIWSKPAEKSMPKATKRKSLFGIINEQGEIDYLNHNGDKIT